MKVNNSIEHENGIWELQISFSGKLQGCPVAYAMMVKGTETESKEDVLYRSKVLAKSIQEIGNDSLNKMK